MSFLAGVGEGAGSAYEGCGPGPIKNGPFPKGLVFYTSSVADSLHPSPQGGRRGTRALINYKELLVLEAPLVRPASALPQGLAHRLWEDQFLLQGLTSSRPRRQSPPIPEQFFLVASSF